MIKHKQNHEERIKIKSILESLLFCESHTPDERAQEEYQTETRLYAKLYHRVIGDWYRKSFINQLQRNKTRGDKCLR